MKKRKRVASPYIITYEENDPKKSASPNEHKHEAQEQELSAKEVLRRKRNIFR